MIFQTLYSKISFVFILVLGCTLLGASHLSNGFPADHGKTSPDRRIRIKAKDGSFYRNGQENPDLTVRTGELVKVTFQNQDTGILHAISIPELNVSKKNISPGKNVTFSFQARKAGKYEYICDHHLPWMKGTIIVRDIQQ